ncbi:MAG: acetate/propionate family kinase [Peptococcaceae bacterium]|jgi:acetate kinase|nr:acetate/propionate family kinase [Peptococcaceae bacterium]MDH7525414.1 acetate/propionate family kinase [Peptococcaceae bacterium]
MKILVANVGSTSYKFQLYYPETGEFIADGKIDRIGGENAALQYVKDDGSGGKTISMARSIKDFAQAVKLSLELLTDPKVGVVQSIEEISGVGFKTVHGGKLSGAVLIDDSVIKAMEDINIVVPAHNRPYIDTINFFREILPATPLVAVFETWFHQNIPDYARTYGIPREWTEGLGVRKYGFHGASHRFIAERVAERWWSREKPLRLISCHLGGSSSLCAIKDGVSIDASQGFSAQCGLPMSNRVGDLDPFAIFYLLDKKGMKPQELADILVKNGGLKGISGLSGDIRDLEEAQEKGDYGASLALRVYKYQLKLYIGAYAAALNGLDVLAFTGGIGENGWRIREDVLNGLGYLGIKFDPEKNKKTRQEGVISTGDSAVLVLVIPANEGKIVGRETARVIRELKAGKLS